MLVSLITRLDVRVEHNLSPTSVTRLDAISRSVGSAIDSIVESTVDRAVGSAMSRAIDSAVDSTVGRAVGSPLVKTYTQVRHSKE